MEINAIGAGWEILYEDEFISEKHWHKELEFAFLLAGRMEICVDGEMKEVQAGELFIISGGVLHYYVEPDEPFQVVVAKISLEMLEGLSEACRGFLGEFYQNVLLVRPDKEIRRIFEDIVGLLETEDGITQETSFVADFIIFTNYMRNHQDLIKERVKSQKNSNAELLDRMQSYLLEHYREKIALSDMAAFLGFSESYCSRYIKKISGMNFLDYLNSYRIMRAGTLLRTTDDPVTEIAYATGFKSIQSFNRVFKFYCGTSPSDYRRRLRERK